MPKAVKIAITIIVIVFAVVVAKDWIVKTSVTTGAQMVLGAPVSISHFSLGMFNSTVHIRDLKIYNPPGFPKEALVEIPLIEVHYVLGDILKQNIHLTKASIDLKQVTVIKNKDGKLNVDSLKIVEKPAAKSGSSKKESPKLRIDELTLTIGQVIFKDYTAGGPPLTQVYDVKIKDRVYKNISSPEELSALVLTEAMKPTAIKGAAIYGVASLAGVAFLPAGIAVTVMGSDSAKGEFKIGYDNAFQKTLALIKEIGQVKVENKPQGLIKANVQSNAITVKLITKDNNAVSITVSARKLLLPQPQTASGILLQISERFKK